MKQLPFFYLLLSLTLLTGEIFAEDELQSIPTEILEMQEMNGATIVTSDNAQIHSTTNTVTADSMTFSGGTSSGTVQFTGSATTYNLGKMSVSQDFKSDIDLNGVNLTVQNMTNDYGATNEQRITPTYSITNTSDNMSVLTITRSECAINKDPYQRVNRSSIDGNIQVVVKPVEIADFPDTKTVPLMYRNKYDRLYLNGDNSYTGGTIVEGLAGVSSTDHNTVLHATGSSVGTGPITLKNLATLMNAHSNQTFTNDIILDNGGAFRVGGNYSLKFTGNISGDGGLHLNYNEANGGDIYLSGDNSYTGNTYLCGYLETTQAGSSTAAAYTVHVESDTAFSTGDVIFSTGTADRQYEVTLKLDNPGGTRIISNDIDVNTQKAIFTKGATTAQAIIAGQISGEDVSVVISNNVNFEIHLDDWVLPSDETLLDVYYMWDMTGNLTFNTETQFTIFTDDPSQYDGKKIYLANTDEVQGSENIQMNLSNANGDGKGKWEMGKDDAKGFYIQHKSNNNTGSQPSSFPTKEMDVPEPTSGLMLLLSLLFLLRGRRKMSV